MPWSWAIATPSGRWAAAAGAGSLTARANIQGSRAGTACGVSNGNAPETRPGSNAVGLEPDQLGIAAAPAAVPANMECALAAGVAPASGRVPASVRSIARKMNSWI